MRKLCQTLLLIGLSAQVLTLSANAAYAGQHDDADRFQQLKDGLTDKRDPFLDKIKEQKEYAEFAATLEKTLKPNENVVCRFNIDNYGRIKNLKVCSEKKPTVLEKKFLALIGKAAPFPYPTHREMIDRGIEIEFWKSKKSQADHMIDHTEAVGSLVRIAPPAHPIATSAATPKENKQDIRPDKFKDLLKGASF